MTRRTNRNATSNLPVWLTCAAAVVAVSAALTFAGSPGAKEMPPPDQLPSVKELPDPFVFLDGSRVKSKDDWKRRREELRDLILYYEYGRMPLPPGNVKAEEDPSYTAPAPSGSNRDPNKREEPPDPPAGATEKKL